MSIKEYTAIRIMQIYRDMFSPGLSIDMMPPNTKATIITMLTNLKKPDLLVKRVVTDENIIKIKVKK